MGIGARPDYVKQTLRDLEAIKVATNEKVKELGDKWSHDPSTENWNRWQVSIDENVAANNAHYWLAKVFH